MRDALLLVALAVIIAGAVSLWFWWIAPTYAAEACRGTVGIASFYGPESGRRTANGSTFDPTGRSAASWAYPLGTWLRVTNSRNGLSVVVLLNDRGPAKRLGRLIDVSRGAAQVLGMVNSGTAPVCVTVMPR